MLEGKVLFLQDAGNVDSWANLGDALWSIFKFKEKLDVTPISKVDACLEFSHADDFERILQVPEFMVQNIHEKISKWRDEVL